MLLTRCATVPKLKVDKISNYKLRFSNMYLTIKVFIVFACWNLQNHIYPFGEQPIVLAHQTQKLSAFTSGHWSPLEFFENWLLVIQVCCFLNKKSYNNSLLLSARLFLTQYYCEKLKLNFPHKVVQYRKLWWDLWPPSLKTFLTDITPAA